MSSTGAGGWVATNALATRIAFVSIVALLLVFGLVMMFSASSVISYSLEENPAALFSRQIIYAVLGLILAVVLALFNYNLLFDKAAFFSYLFWLVIVGLIGYALLQDTAILGSHRQIDLGPVSVQPGEFVKIAILLVLVHLVERVSATGLHWQLVLCMLAAILIPLVLLAAQPDLGTLLIAAAGILAVLWMGGFPKRIVFVIVVILIAAALVMVLVADFRQSRIGAFLNPQADPLGSGYQILNAFYAFGDGGAFGVGIGMSKQKFGYLPEAHNDFIFAIVGEELGLVGALAVVALFFGLLIFGLAIARQAPNRGGTLIAAVATVLISTQAFLNMLCVVGAAPVTGKPLPFFSAGGSSLLSTMFLVGLILSVSMHTHQAAPHELRREQLRLIDGGRNRHKEVSRPGEKRPRRTEEPVALPISALERIFGRGLVNMPEHASGRASAARPASAARSARVSSAKKDTARIPVAISTAIARHPTTAPAVSLGALRKNRSGLAQRVAIKPSVPMLSTPSRFAVARPAPTRPAPTPTPPTPMLPSRLVPIIPLRAQETYGRVATHRRAHKGTTKSVTNKGIVGSASQDVDESATRGGTTKSVAQSRTQGMAKSTTNGSTLPCIAQSAAHKNAFQSTTHRRTIQSTPHKGMAGRTSRSSAPRPVTVPQRRSAHKAAVHHPEN
ncbi:MAG: putative lipid II flippase FtsW [Coriobacteriales bacterium]|nr:putative lipid II flippase FtsW [Coriobacteriales bacterium]